MYSKIKDYIEDAIDYFPDYNDTPDYLPPKKFMWDIFATLDYDLACTFVDYSMKQRNSVNNDKDKTIEIDEDIYKELEASNFFSKKKGTAINMLTIGRINKSIIELNLIEPNSILFQYFIIYYLLLIIHCF